MASVGYWDRSSAASSSTPTPAEPAHKTLWIPYAGIAGGVLILTLVFAMTKLPDLVGEDTFHVDEDQANPQKAYEDDRKSTTCYRTC